MPMSRKGNRGSLPFELTLLGTNAATPAFDRHPSAQVLCVQDHYYLIDCGEGTQMQMLKYAVKRSKIKQIFISHLHGDHVYGLIGLLNSFALNGRSTPLAVFGPEGLEEMIMIQVKYGGGGFPYPLEFHVVDCSSSGVIFEDHLLSVQSIPLVHRVPTSGFLFKEKQRPRNIIGEKIIAYQIPYSEIPGIKSGADFILPDGRIISNSELTIDPPEPRSYAYCSDTRYSETILPIIKGVDLLYHESTFCADMQEQAEASMHSTALEAATIAKKAGIKKLLLGHFSSRYRDVSPFEEEARSVFAEAYIGVEGETHAVEVKRERL